MSFYNKHSSLLEDSSEIQNIGNIHEATSLLFIPRKRRNFTFIIHQKKDPPKYATVDEPQDQKCGVPLIFQLQDL